MASKTSFFLKGRQSANTDSDVYTMFRVVVVLSNMTSKDFDAIVGDARERKRAGKWTERKRAGAHRAGRRIGPEYPPHL